MNCEKCGTPLRGTEQFCRNCGSPVNRIYQSGINNGLNNQYLNNSEFNRYNMNNNYNNEQKKYKLKYFIIGFLSAVVAFVIFLLIIGILFGDNSEQKDKLNDKPNVTIPDDFNHDDVYKVDYQGFTFSIPSELLYEIDDDTFFISDKYKKWRVYVSIGEGTYLKMLNNKDYLSNFYREKGYTTSDAFERKINKTQYITMEFTYNNYNGIIAYTSASPMHIFGLTVYSYNNNYDYNIIQQVSEILKSAEYNIKDDNISVFNGLTLSVISQLGK